MQATTARLRVGPWLKQIETLLLRRESLAERRRQLGGNATADHYPTLFRRIEEVADAIREVIQGKRLPASEVNRLVSLTQDEPPSAPARSHISDPLTAFLARQRTLWVKVGR